MSARHWTGLVLIAAFVSTCVLLLDGRGWLVALAGAGLATSACLLVLAFLRAVDALGPEETGRVLPGRWRR